MVPLNLKNSMRYLFHLVCRLMIPISLLALEIPLFISQSAPTPLSTASSEIRNSAHTSTLPLPNTPLKALTPAEALEAVNRARQLHIEETPSATVDQIEAKPTPDTKHDEAIP
jgi:hypothetical protein